MPNELGMENAMAGLLSDDPSLTASIEAEQEASLSLQKKAEPAKAHGEPPVQTNSAEKANDKKTESPITNTLDTQKETDVTPEDKPAVEFSEVDPQQMYKLADGREILGSQLLYSMMEKDKLDKEKWQLNKEKSELQGRLGWVDKIEQDDYARVYMQLKDSGLSTEEAIRVASAKIPQKSEQPAAAAAATSLNTITVDPAELAKRLPSVPQGIEDGSPEHLNWIYNVYEPAKLAAVSSMTVEAVLRAQDARQESKDAERIERDRLQETQKKQMQQAIDHNSSMISKAGEMLFAEHGIAYDKLTETEKKDVQDRLSAAFKLNSLDVGDEAWMAKNILNERDIKLVVKEAYPKGNIYKAPSRPGTTQTTPLSADSPAPQVKAMTNKNYGTYATEMDGAMADLMK